MRRYWITQQNWQNEELEISGDEYHHIFKVCRTTVGERFEILGDSNTVHLAEVLEVNKKNATVKRLSSRALPELNEPHLHLCLSVPRPQILPLILEKSVELGVHSVHLFYSDHSYFKAKDGNKLNWAKFDKVINQALQQSSRGHKMPLNEPIPLKELLKTINRRPMVQCLFPCEPATVGATAGSINDELKRIKKAAPKEIYYFIGSEGGFSLEDSALMQEADIKPVTLGAQVLRVETACVAVASILKYEFELLKGE
jgi:16S rRNA (uracil1498-N3)-methyltransferase